MMYDNPLSCCSIWTLHIGPTVQLQCPKFESSADTSAAQVNYPILVNGIVAAGCIYSGVSFHINFRLSCRSNNLNQTNPGYTSHELKHTMKCAHVSLIITEPEILPNILAAADANNIPRSRILIFDNGLPGQSVPQGFKSWRTLFSHGETDWPRFDDLATAKTTTAARLFSSGTTGLPKAAVLSHYNFVAQHYIAEEFPQRRPYVASRLLPLPFFHIAVGPRTHFSPLRDGTTTYTMRRFALEPYLANIEKYAITDLLFVPPVVIAIINSPLRHKYSMKSVKYAFAGAAPLGPEAQARMKALMSKDAPCTQVWGMTETTCISTLFPYPEHDTTGSVGRPAPGAGIDLKLVDEEGKDITDYDVRGEMCVRGPNVVQGYLDNPEANKSWDEDGFFHTGDIMYCDGKTKLWYVVDRKKELIKVRAFQVAPPEVESVLLDHPQIVDAAVIGIDNGDAGELPRGYVVRRQGPEGAKLTEQDIHKHVDERLARYKRLDGGVVFMDEVSGPRSQW